MKKMNEIKKLVTDDRAVSAVIGTVLMLSVTIAVSSGVAVGIVKFGESGRKFLDAQTDRTDAQMNMTRAEIGVIERFTDYLDTLNFNIPDDNTTDCPLPDVEYEWNDTANDWDVFMVWAEADVLLQIYPPHLDSEKGEPIFPPPPPSSSNYGEI